jgi:hypothetical protein
MSVMESEVIRHCERCDGESNYLINYLTPNNVPDVVCWECVEQEDQRSMRFSPSSTRQRRAVSRVY